VGRLAVFDFIEGWYNPTRRHSGLDYLSPVEFERQGGGWARSAVDQTAEAVG
jgi:putative transposase